MKLAIIAFAATALATGAGAGTVTFNFDSPTGNLGTTNTYTVGALSIVATAEDTPARESPDLYGKALGGDENGLGLADDPSGDHEIAYGEGFVQLGVGNLFGKVIAADTDFSMNSTTDGEEWAVYGSNTAGSLGTFLTSGTDEGSHLLPSFGSYDFYNFEEIAQPGTGNCQAGCGANVLISEITSVTSVPEPATWAMLLVGFFGLGGIIRSRRRMATASA